MYVYKWGYEVYEMRDVDQFKFTNIKRLKNKVGALNEQWLSLNKIIKFIT